LVLEKTSTGLSKLNISTNTSNYHKQVISKLVNSGRVSDDLEKVVARWAQVRVDGTHSLIERSPFGLNLRVLIRTLMCNDIVWDIAMLVHLDGCKTPTLVLLVTGFFVQEREKG